MRLEERGVVRVEVEHVGVVQLVVEEFRVEILLWGHEHLGGCDGNCYGNRHAVSYENAEELELRARLLAAEIIEGAANAGTDDEGAISLGVLDPYVCVAVMCTLAAVCATEIPGNPKPVSWVVAALRGDELPKFRLRNSKIAIPWWLWMLQCAVLGFAGAFLIVQATT